MLAKETAITLDRPDLETSPGGSVEDQPTLPTENVTLNIHSFFLIPFLILVGIGILFGIYILGVTLLTQESRDVYDLLETIKTGRNHDRWRSAFELSGVLARDSKIGFDKRFVAKMTNLFQDPDVIQITTQNGVSLKAYLAQAMGSTKNPAFTQLLLEAIDDIHPDTAFIISALGLLGDKRSAQRIHPLTLNPSAAIRLAAVIALGEIGNLTSISILEQALNDDEPNVRWDAAVALSKMKSEAGKVVLLDLLRPGYLEEFKSVDQNERNRILVVAIRSAGELDDPELNQAIGLLAENRNLNMDVLKTALEVKR